MVPNKLYLCYKILETQDSQETQKEAAASSSHRHLRLTVYPTLYTLQDRRMWILNPRTPTALRLALQGHT